MDRVADAFAFGLREVMRSSLLRVDKEFLELRNILEKLAPLLSFIDEKTDLGTLPFAQDDTVKTKTQF